jgi:hypothetical protein
MYALVHDCSASCCSKSGHRHAFACAPQVKCNSVQRVSRAQDTSYNHNTLMSGGFLMLRPPLQYQ